jgi:hypothetical protein
MTSYSVPLPRPAGGEHRQMLARKIDAQRWEGQNEAAKHRGAWVDPAGGTVKGGEQTERWYKQAEQARCAEPKPASP